MKAKLWIATDSKKGDELIVCEEAIVGRSRNSAIQLEGGGVSSRHARVYFDPERKRYFLEDLESLNGTTLDGLAVVRPEPLDRLHVIGIAGVHELIFQELDREPAEAASADAAGGDELPTKPTVKTAVDEEMPALPVNLPGDELSAEPTARTAVDEEMPALPVNLAGDEPPTKPMPKTSVDEQMPSLPANLADGQEAEDEAADEAADEAEVPETPEPGMVFSIRFEADGPPDPMPLPEGERVVGRSRSADITVESRSVSRRHAVLAVSGGRVTLRDLESRNHTFVNGERITDETQLEPGARLRFGDLEAELLGEEVGS